MDFLAERAINGTRRILSVWLPRLPTDRLERRYGKQPDLPLVIAAKIDNALRIHALNAAASRLGLSEGQALANAKAMVPTLKVAEANEVADAKLLDQIADWCDRFTPYVAFDAPHGLFLDLTGVTHLFGGERKMVTTIAAALKTQGFTVCVGLAGTAAAAYALSRYAPGKIAEPGREAEAISALPVGALNCSAKVAHALRRAGLKTVGQVAARQRAELTSRFGKEFAHQLERALGRSEKPISPRRPLPDFLAEHRFAEPVVTEDAIVATLHALATSLAAVLEERGQGARSLEAVFFRADGAVRRILVATGAPTRDPNVIARLFRTKLDALVDPIDPGFGFDLIRLEATLAQKSEAEAVSLGKDDRGEREVAQLIDQLSARFGSHRVLKFVPQDSHIPEAEAVLIPAQYDIKGSGSWEPRRNPLEMPRRPLRLLEKPEPISVMAQIPDGPPLRFRWRNVLHTAAFAAGPESIGMEWWKSQSPTPTRDYFRVEDEEGRRYWLYRDGEYHAEGAEPRWFMHGLFA